MNVWKIFAPPPISAPATFFFKCGSHVKIHLIPFLFVKKTFCSREKISMWNFQKRICFWNKRWKIWINEMPEKNSLAFICNEQGVVEFLWSERFFIFPHRDKRWKRENSIECSNAGKKARRENFHSYQHNDSSHQCLTGGGKKGLRRAKLWIILR